MDYATLAQMKARMGRTDDRDDTIMSMVLSAASRQIEGMCNREFGQDTGTRTFTAELTTMAEVDDFVSITSLATDLDGNGSFETVWAATDYIPVPTNATALGVPYTRIDVMPMGRYLFPVFNSTPRVPANRRGVQVVATWGWPSVPSAITEATLLVAIRLFKRIDAPYGMAGNPDVGQMTIMPGRDPDVLALIAPYIRPALVL